MLRFVILAAAALVPTAIAAQEAFVGAYVHGVDTPFTFETEEQGVDFVAGYRFPPLTGLSAVGSPAPYLIGSANTRGDTSFAGAGLSWTFGDGAIYLRPAVGVVVHDGPDYRVGSNGRRTELGSRLLFEPEVALGYRLSDRLALEASWIHISHARLFDAEQNPGIDMWGARLSIGL